MTRALKGFMNLSYVEVRHVPKTTGLAPGLQRCCDIEVGAGQDQTLDLLEMRSPCTL